MSMKTSVYISDKTVIDVVPYTARRTILRLDVGPFAVLYLAIYWAMWRWSLRDGWVVLVALPAVLACHLLVFLSTQWSVRFMCLVSQRRVDSIDDAENVRVVPAKHCGSEELLPLERRWSPGMRDTGRDDADKGGASLGQQHKEVTLLGSRGSLEVAGQAFGLPDLWFVFQQTKFVYTFDGKQSFQRLEYPTTGSFRAYLGCRGHVDETALALAVERWGPNVLDIPLPAFSKLFAEQAVAPFFVFQILCVMLWSLDNYWFYALFTLCMLVLFEAMLCFQRQKNLEMLRSMRREPIVVYALRSGRWRRVSSEAVTPGEVVSLVPKPPTVANAIQEAHRRAQHLQQQQQRPSIGRGFPAGMRGGEAVGAGSRAGLDILSGEGGRGMELGGTARDDEALVPFDVVLMRGNCVVNEAMLTGESVPQAKTSIASAGVSSSSSEDSWIRLEDGTDSPHRKHIVFGGTKVLQNTDNNAEGIGLAGSGTMGLSGSVGEVADWTRLPPPPDGGCPCVVLRTGFETSQGQLMKTILFATKRVVAGSDWETGVFILILLVFAAVASAYVLAEGLADETRNSFKLVLHCIMILTSVIPPELPIELSLAVINSLTALTVALIFCTEPFRIPLAGKVDVCCFDKTGTLTSDNLLMRGVAGAPGGGHPPAPAAGVIDDGDDAAASAPAKIAVPAGELGEVPTRILAGCHSLMTLNGSLVGDSVEVATLKGLGWACMRGGLVAPRASAREARAISGSEVASSQTLGGADPALQPLQIVHAWPFDPTLRRMSTAVRLATVISGSRTAASSSQKPHVRRRGSAGERGSGHRGGKGGDQDGIPPFHDRLWIVSKGAPEALEPLFVDAPENYRSTFLYHMGQGSRVLALGYRALDCDTSVDACRRMTRASAEQGLRFGGFLVLGCPLKPDARYVVRELKESSHGVAMITGDGALTAADVARQVGMIDQPPGRTLVLSLVRQNDADEVENDAGALEKVDPREYATAAGGTRAAVIADSGSGVSGGACWSSTLYWISLTAESSGAIGVGGRERTIPFDAESLETLAESHALCVTGEVLSHVSAMAMTSLPGTASTATAALDAARVGTDTKIKTIVDSSMRCLGGRKALSMPTSALSSLCSSVTVFARVSPAQKELIVGVLSASGKTTLMCGDGTNDVGALRRAHVGVSIVNSPELEKRLEVFLDKKQQQRAEQGGTSSGGAGGRERKRKSQRVSEAKRSRMLAMQEIEEQNLDPTLVKLGDASIASPFTAKTTSVGCVLAVIRQGRCTLVTTLQVYKILALNCLISAYMLSALYFKGVKQGDCQMVILGLLVSTLFYCASRSKPLRKLSAVRPPSGIFEVQACSTVLGQFVVHLVALFTVTRLCEAHINPEDPSMMPDGPFHPTVFNSSVFLLSWVMQINTFTANYTGHPFMQSLRQNRPMCFLVVVAYGTLIVVASGLSPTLESWLQLSPFPTGFRGPLLAVLIFDTASVFIVETVTGWCRRRSGGGRKG